MELIKLVGHQGMVILGGYLLTGDHQYTAGILLVVTGAILINDTFRRV